MHVFVYAFDHKIRDTVLHTCGHQSTAMMHEHSLQRATNIA